METSEKVVLREQPEIKDLLQTLMKQGLKKGAKKKLSDCIDINTDFKNGLRDQS